jgi:hypothetical protein
VARNQVRTSFKKVVRKKHPKRAKFEWAEQIRLPEGLSPLARYVEENMGVGISPEELIEQFQEYDCEHNYVVLAVGPEEVLDHCPACGKIVKRKK